jgi:1-acyl-sn-glycerol-3-phosphate acyltransferase
LIDALQSGDSVIIFPEGTRGFEADPAPFKAGLYNLAQRFPNARLIPAWINNVQRVMPKGEVIPVPILCSVTFGAPIVLGEAEDRKEFLTRARAAVIALRDV